MFPSSYNKNIYRSKNQDLRYYSDDQLYKHYIEYGVKEGRVCCPVDSRSSFVSLIPTSISILEIGPLDAPLIRGNNVKYCDVLNQEQLLLKSKMMGRTNNVPYIDYVSPTGDLSIINDKFDMVVSSHCVEHQLDLIKHLQQVSSILKDGGCYALVVPDKRYCFDHFIQETTIADIIEMHYSKRTRHSLKSLIDHRAMTGHNDSVQHWCGNHGNKHWDAQTITNAIKEYNSTDDYIDIHSMQFTPSSFGEIITLLTNMNLIDLCVSNIYNTVKNGIEFYAVLEKTKHGQGSIKE